MPPAIIIVSLIDVLIVVLIFLMVTTTFKQTPSVKLNLPQSSDKKAGAQEKEPPLIVTIPKEGPIYFGPLPVTMEQLKIKFQEATRKGTNVSLAIRADTEAGFGQVIKVMDAAKAANIRAVNAFTKNNIEPER
ncbi:MAG: biopolymer transporter ExbD [Verrucomicrobiales bacterium]|nr:biopolymer transporter ExbD [Verrucomicrobiales bacterium]